MIAILSAVRWSLIAVLIFTSLIITNVECFHMPFGPLYVFFGEMSKFLPTYWLSWGFFAIELDELLVYFAN